MATRDAGQKAITALADVVPNLIGGSGDLDPSTRTALKGHGDFESPLFKPSEVATPTQGLVGGPIGYAGRNNPRLDLNRHDSRTGAVAGDPAESMPNGPTDRLLPFCFGPRPILVPHGGFCGALPAQIASFGALRGGRLAGSLANTGITGERFPGLRIERCGPAQTVGLLELTEGPPRLRTQDAIKRSFVESLMAKLDLRPANVVFPKGVASHRTVRSSSGRRHGCRVQSIACVGRIIQSGAPDTQS